MFLKKYSLRLVLGCVVACLSLAAHAQETAQSLIDASRKTYTDAPFLAMDVQVFSFETPQTKKGTLLGSGLMRKRGNDYYSKFGTDELLSNERCLVIADHATHTLLVSEHTKKNGRMNPYMPMPDSLQKQNDTVVYKGLVNAQHLLVFSNASGLIQKTEVFLDAKTMLISRLIYYYAASSEEESADVYKVEILYTNVSLSEPDASYFSEKRFVQYQNKRWVAVAPYTKYRLTVSSTPQL